MRHFSISLVPNFWSSTFVMRFSIAQVIILIHVPRVWNFGRQTFRNRIIRTWINWFHIGWTNHHFSTNGTQNVHFSLDCLSDITKIHLYPFTMAANAKPIPVLPDVPSMIVPPGCKRPSASASSIILRAIRSLVELPGLKVSYLANTKHGKSLVSLLICTKGVLPMVSRIFFAYFIFALFAVQR